ncbi:hypothetical protein KR093_009462 [Drosophila rubida]|uniref:Uncharacterized protein n=1 Tax=Drosophila rubida TaxID=30044 RepID=A0AAD4K8L8_9MUSC|nr:hypothetical protein KR093_009462 [Drosophila rubida]
MDYRNNAYGIGQRRVVNDASSSFAPNRGGGGGGIGIDDNFRGSQSMNYGFNNNSSNNSGNNSNSDFGFGNNNNQRFASMDSKFGSMQSNNYGRSTENLGYGGNQQRFGHHTSSSNVSSGNFGNDSNYRGGQMNQQRSFGDQQQQQQQRFNNMSDVNRSSSSGDYSSGSGSFRGSLQPPQQQSSQLGSLSLGRSISDLGYNNNNDNSNGNNNNNNGNQRFYNNDRNDAFRRADNFSDNFNRGQESFNLARNFKFNNERNENFGRQMNNSGGSNNFGYMNQNQNNQNRAGGGGFDDNFRSPNLNNHNFDNNKSNNHQFNNNKPRNGDMGFSNAQNFRGQQNSEMPAGQALAAINDTVNALMTNQSNWQVGNNNNGFGQGNFNSGGGNYRNNNAGNRNNNNNNAGNVRNNGPNQGGNRQQQQLPNHGKNFKPAINKSQAPIAARQFQGNRNQNQNQNQSKPNTNISNINNKPNHQAIKKNNNISNINKPQQPANQAAAKNVNGGQKPPQPKAAVPAKAAQNTQAKPKPEIKKDAAEVKPKVAPKRPASQPVAPLTKADVKRRKLAIKRGFLLGGFKLPYVNNNRVALPQPEDKSYAVMFFEQALNYSTSGEELDDETIAGPEAIPDATDAEGKNAGRTLVKRIRKRLHFEWTQVEESKKYKSWPTWWTDYKWCEQAIHEELETFGSVNLRNCFLPDLPRLTTEQVVDVIVKQAHFGLDKNSDNYFNNMKSILTLMNVTFLENLKMPNSERVQDMIRAVPNDFWCYKMRSMVYLWAQYLKISKTSSPSTETGVKELQAIARDWKNPLFHWIAKQAYDELKAISEVEWPEHKQQYEEIKSTAPTSS